MAKKIAKLANTLPVYDSAKYAKKDPDHAFFSVSSVTHTMELVDGAGNNVQVKWESSRHGIYKLTVERDNGSGNQQPYSLFNLNLQARNWPVTVSHDKTDGVTVELLESTSDPDPAKSFKAVKPLTVVDVETWDVPATNAASAALGLNDPNDISSLHYLRAIEDNVWFLRFSGRKCSLTVWAKRESLGPTLPLRDVLPPHIGNALEYHGGFEDGGYPGGE